MYVLAPDDMPAGAEAAAILRYRGRFPIRQLTVRMPRGSGEKVLAIARDHGGTNFAGLEATSEGNPFDDILAHVPNAQVGLLLDGLEGEPDLHVTLLP